MHKQETTADLSLSALKNPNSEGRPPAYAKCGRSNEPKHCKRIYGKFYLHCTKDCLKPNISCVKDNDPYNALSNQRAKDRWDLGIVIGSDLTLNCITTGHPPGRPPSDIRWTKQNDSHDGKDHPSSTRPNHLPQLFIEKVKKEDEGKYQCVAGNIAGEKAFIELQLTVITFVVSEFLFAIGAFLWDRRLVKQVDIHESPPKAREAWGNLKEYLDCDNPLNKSNRHYFFINRQSNQANYFLQRTECYDYNQIRANNGQSIQANYFLQQTEYYDYNRPNKSKQRTE
ncbi:hypothetical protein pdam_00002802 [Pocillopora damicornis]|uniref:Ig-like domain-containing protein n=2 Tax=Pocillopora TaxID=46730 RepID=A0A3M6TT89_POCDA|nr:hypothetical protein pdam_00002802 [Pocillopora damicornis]